MDLKITGRHEGVTEELRAYAEEKLGRVERYNNLTRLLEVVFDGSPKLVKVEGKAHVGKGAPIVVHAEHGSAEGAVDLLHDLLERALRRKKEKVRDRLRGRHHGGSPNAGEVATAVGGAAARGSSKPRDETSSTTGNEEE